MTAIVGVYGYPVEGNKSISFIAADTRVTRKDGDYGDGYNKIFIGKSSSGETFMIGLSGNDIRNFSDFAQEDKLNEIASSSRSTKSFAHNLVNAIDEYNSINQEKSIKIEALRLLVLGKDGMGELMYGNTYLDKIPQKNKIDGSVAFTSVGNRGTTFLREVQNGLQDNTIYDNPNNTIKLLRDKIITPAIKATSNEHLDIDDNVTIKYIQHDKAFIHNESDELAAKAEDERFKKARIIVGTTNKNHKISNNQYHGKACRYSLEMLQEMADQIKDNPYSSVYRHSEFSPSGSLIKSAPKIGYLENPEIKSTIDKKGKRTYKLYSNVYIDTHDSIGKEVHEKMKINKNNFKISAGLFPTEDAICRNEDEEYILWNSGKLFEVAILDTKYEPPFDMGCEVLDIAAGVDSQDNDTDAFAIYASAQKTLDNTVKYDNNSHIEFNNDIMSNTSITTTPDELQKAVESVLEKRDRLRQEEKEKERIRAQEEENKSLKDDLAKSKAREKEFEEILNGFAIKEKEYVDKDVAYKAIIADKEAEVKTLQDFIVSFTGQVEQSSSQSNEGQTVSQ